MTVENNYAIAISTLSDWLKNFAPVYQQMKRKTKTTFCTRDFSRALSNVPGIGHFTVVCSATKPMNGCEAAGDLALIQTSLLLSCKLCCCNAN